MRPPGFLREPVDFLQMCSRLVRHAWERIGHTHAPCCRMQRTSSRIGDFARSIHPESGWTQGLQGLLAGDECTRATLHASPSREAHHNENTHCTRQCCTPGGVESLELLPLSCCTLRGYLGSTISMACAWFLVCFAAPRPTVMASAASCQGIVEDASLPHTWHCVSTPPGWALRRPIRICSK